MQTYGWWNVKKASEEAEIPIASKYHQVNFFTRIPTDREINKLRTKYMVDTLIESSKRGGTAVKDIEVDQEALGMHLAGFFIDWENYFELEPITEEEWESLEDEDKHPTIYPRRTKTFYRKVQSEFNRKKIKELIMQDMLFFVIGVFFNKAALNEAIDEEVLESELKNYVSSSPPVS